jgi:uncharacterized protein
MRPTPFVHDLTPAPPAPPRSLDPVEGSFLSLTTYRRDGSAVPTTVWFVVEDGRVLVQTDENSGKVSRIRRSSHVVIAPCTYKGRVKGPAYEASARVLPADELDHVKRLIARKYRISLLVIRPIRWFQTRRHPERTAEVALEIRRA